MEPTIPHANNLQPSRGIAHLEGACPLCGAGVPRRVTLRGTATFETYQCARDGEVRYAGGSATQILVNGTPVYEALSAPRPESSGFEAWLGQVRAQVPGAAAS